MFVSDLIRKHPQVFHMAEAGTWPQIQRNGLLSTSALLDLFEISGQQRFEIESVRRPQIVEIVHPEHGRALIRDNKPLREQFLRCLPGTTPQQFYELLNGKVFFWVSRERLETLIGARAYRRRAHDVLTVDTAALLERYADTAAVASINTGSTLYPNAPPRGRDSFRPIADFDCGGARRRGRPANTIVELTIDYAVRDIADILVKVESRQADYPAELLWQR